MTRRARVRVESLPAAVSSHESSVVEWAHQPAQKSFGTLQDSGSVHGHLFADVTVHSRGNPAFRDREQFPRTKNTDLQDEIETITAEPGRPLPHRAELENLLGQSLEGVEVYTSEEARHLLQRLGARAAVFADKLLLADAEPSLDVLLHEAVHLLQGRHGNEVNTPALGLDVIPVDSPIEEEAQRIEQELFTEENGESDSETPAQTAPVEVENLLAGQEIALQRIAEPEAPLDIAKHSRRPGIESWVVAPSQRFEQALETAKLSAPQETPTSALEDRAPAAGEPPAVTEAGIIATETPIIEETPAESGLESAQAPAAGAPDVAAQEQTRAQAEAALQGAEDVSGLVEAYAAAPPTVKARQAAELNQHASDLSQQEAQKLEESVPEVHASLNTQVESAPSLEVATPTTREITLEASAPAPVQLPDLPVTPDPGRYSANNSVMGNLERGLNATGGDRLAEIGESLSDVRTSDPQIPRSPGPPPTVPLEGETNPARLQEQTASSVEEGRGVRDEARQAVLSGPGPEQVQPLQMDEAVPLPALERPVLETPAAPEAQLGDGPDAYLVMELSPDVQAQFDQDQQGAMQASMEQARVQTGQAADERDRQRQERVDEAETESQRLSQQADEDQRRQVQATRQDIQNERQSTIDQQNTAVQNLERDAENKRQEDRASIDGRVQNDQRQIEGRYQSAEEESNRRIQEGERQAEQRREQAEREASEQSWWDRAVNFVRDAFNALVSAISTIFDAIRSAVNAVLDAAKVFAETLISAVADFIKSAIAVFGEFLKGLVNALLADIFPGLAAALNEFIDRAVEAAQRAVDAVAETLRNAVNSLIEGLRAGLNSIINTFQAAVQTGLALMQAALTGDWSALAMKVLEAVLRIVGVNPEDFYAFIGRARETIQIIIDDPGAFVGHLIDAFLGGVRQFGENFLTHLQTSIIEWLTGALGGAGITIPEHFDLMGVLSLVQQILGLTWDRMRQKAVRLIGERNVAILEHIYSYIETLVTGGWPALFERIVQDLSGLVDTVLDGIRNFLVERIIVAAVTRLATLFNPVGAIVQLVMAAWNLYTFLRDQLARIIQVVQTVVDAIGNIARGVIAPASNAVESTLGRLLTFAIDLLARFLGLGGISARVREIIETVRARVDQAIDQLLERIRAAFRPGRGGAGEAQPATAAQATEAEGQLGAFQFSVGNEQHRLWFQTVQGRPQMMVASETKDFDVLVSELTTRIQLLENGDEKSRLMNQINQARSLSTTVESEQVQAATRAARGSGVTSPQAAPQENIRREVEQLIEGLRAVMIRANSIPRDFTPGAIQYSPQGSRAGRAQGWLAKNAAPRSGSDQSAVSGPANQFFTRLRSEGISVSATFDAGHLIGSRYGGDGTRRNLVPMESRMNRSWFSAFEARVDSHVEQGEAIYADVQAQYGGDPFARLVNPEDLSPEQTMAALPVFETIPQAVTFRAGRRAGDGNDQPLFSETFDPRERLALTISRARPGIAGEEFTDRSSAVYRRLDEKTQ